MFNSFSTRSFLCGLPAVSMCLLALTPTTDQYTSSSSLFQERDSLHYQVTSGESLIFALPDSLETQLVRAYTLSTPPATSWLQGSSFVWKTRDVDQGHHTLTFSASLENNSTDTLFVTVSVE